MVGFESPAIGTFSLGSKRLCVLHNKAAIHYVQCNKLQVDHAQYIGRPRAIHALVLDPVRRT